MFLTAKEIIELTGYKQKDKQINWLNSQGFSFLLRGDGGVVILRSHVEEVLGLSNSKRRAPQPDFSMFE